MTVNTTDIIPPVPQINDRAVPRWQVGSIACAVLSGGEWHSVTILNISLGGAKVQGHWDVTLPVTAVSLTDAGQSSDETFLMLQAECVWTKQASVIEGQVSTTVALRFDIPNRTTAANLLKFLSSYIADGQSC
jgi:hypothetical protein